MTKALLVRDMEESQSNESLTMLSPEQPERVEENVTKEIKARPKLVGKPCSRCGQLFRGPSIAIHARECKFIPPGSAYG